jgi:hypothetical protein
VPNIEAFVLLVCGNFGSKLTRCKRNAQPMHASNTGRTCGLPK